MTYKFADIKVGDKVLTMARGRPGGYLPVISHDVHTVTKVTQTQFVTGKNTRFRKSDGKQIVHEHYYSYAKEATSELLQQHEEQVDAYDRYRTAVVEVNDLFNIPLYRMGLSLNIPLHKMGLSLKQIEALAAAWKEIKEME